MGAKQFQNAAGGADTGDGVGVLRNHRSVGEAFQADEKHFAAGGDCGGGDAAREWAAAGEDSKGRQKSKARALPWTRQRPRASGHPTLK